MRITAHTGLLGVIGDPIEHSLSPVLHNHVLGRLGLDYSYLAFRVTPERLPGLAAALRTLGLKGLNVTIPHKEAVVGQLERLTDAARALQAVNTIGIEGGLHLTGHNTDIAGFLGSLELRGLLARLEEGAAVLLGAGGAARAVLYGLGQSGLSEATLVNRSPERARELAAWGKQQFPSLRLQVLSPEDTPALAAALKTATITVNLTPLGMAPATVEHSPLPPGLLPRPGSILYDTIYNPQRTRLLAEGEVAGCLTVDGLDMLIIQGLESLGWWLERPIPWRELIEELRAVLRLELKRMAQ